MKEKLGNISLLILRAWTDLGFFKYRFHTHLFKKGRAIYEVIRKLHIAALEGGSNSGLFMHAKSSEMSQNFFDAIIYTN